MDERDVLLLRRIQTLGSACVGEVVLDLEPAALAAWLGVPSAKQP